MFIYWIRLPEHNNIFNEGYVGIAKNFKQRMFAHKSCAKIGKEQTLYNAIRKHGWDNLLKEIILISDNEYCLKIEEKLRPQERIGWNIAIGGGKISGASLKGIKQSEKHLKNRCAALKGRKSGFVGKKHSEAAKEKCRLANKGKIVSEKTKQKIKEIKNKQIKINGIVYESWNQASLKIGIPTGSIDYVMKNKPTTGKWAFFDIQKVV